MLFSYFLLQFTTLCFGAVDFEEGGRRRALSLSEKIHYEEFLDSFNFYNKYDIKPRQSNFSSLAYVTPWNSRGYRVAKLFASKFTHLSPVWFRISPVSTKVEGIRDMDSRWIKEVKSTNSNVKIVPRLLFEEWRDLDYQKLFRQETLEVDCIKSVVDVIIRQKLDGIVLEIWLQHSGTSQHELMQFIRKLAKAIHKEGKIFILAIPPPVHQGGYSGTFLKPHFDFLEDDVDFFSLMSYDYSNPYMPGPNSPIEWVQECVNLLVPEEKNLQRTQAKRSKLLVGLNFYGYDFIPSQRSGNPVLGHEFVNLIAKHRPEFKWEKKWAEHLVKYSDSQGNEHHVFFPSMLSIARRIAVTEVLGTGISIWEIGQGLDSFFEQL